jgi:hypothetical protein
MLTGNTTENRQNNATYVSYDPAKARNGSQGQIAPTHVSLTSIRSQLGASYWPIIAQCTRVRVKPDIMKNSK